jgi:hypothetical protein
MWAIDTLLRWREGVGLFANKDNWSWSRYLLADMEELIIIAYGISGDHRISTWLILVYNL